MASVHIAGQTDVGRSRHDNQDTFISQPLWSAQDALLVVIDGVGGYAGGAEAAGLARESITQYMATPTGDTLTMLREAVIYANNQIVRQRQQDPSLGRMCCVLTAAVADAATSKLLYVHVGDTRLYRFRQQELEKLTHDHSLVGVREDANQLTEREAMRHPRRNEILRDVGSVMHRVDDPDFLESGETDFLPGDALLLCSDGLTDMLTRATITDVLTQPLPADEQITELIRLANEQGGQDNITVVLAQHLAEDAASIADAPVREPVRTSEPPPDLLARVAGHQPTPVPSRTRKPWLVVLGVVLLGAVLTALLWPRANSIQPATSSQPTAADSAVSFPSAEPISSTATLANPQPDSTR
ncbi:PP2C family protein-serine/threonine phosphatase [Fibrivirga algicola]|uniref:Serine/threonine-protein phosphatase n=1 Tax=Fibrivirga algicola TaxID=2950420 RepID=A0ABX0QQD2_9BACT|nr:protein phosphatase 2C domain-containing protein [Fibrivirga algicola]NID12374.1 serine/threonine-protein phosphatase [Fibrivirga algicola]